MGIRKLILNMRMYKHVRKGFHPKQAKVWVRSVQDHKKNDYGFSKKETYDAIKAGFMPEQLKAMGITAEESGDYISIYDYAFLKPMNAGYSKWLNDKYTRYNMFKPLRKDMPELYYLIVNYVGKIKVVASGGAEGTKLDDVLNFVKKKGVVSLGVANGNTASELKYEGDTFYLDGSEMTADAIKKLIRSTKFSLVVCEKLYTSDVVNHGILNLVVFNSEGDNPQIGDAYFKFGNYEIKPITKLGKAEESEDEEVFEDEDEKPEVEITSVPADEKTGTWNGKAIPYWDEIKKSLMEFCHYVPELEFFGVEVLINENGFKIVQLKGNPEYPPCKPFSKETSAYLKRKVEEKKKFFAQPGIGRHNALDKVRRKVRRKAAKMFFPVNIKPYWVTRWPEMVIHDFFSNKGATFKEKMWAYKHGFLSYRLKQYGITPENHEKFIADFEYAWLRNINNSYRMWLTDKISLKYLCSDYNECFPAYYYHIIPKNGANKIISMMDLPEGYVNEYDEIFRLVEEKGVLALKRDSGSHGEGFYKFEYADGIYKLNFEEVTREDVLAILKDPENKYLVTEYINMCDELKAVYDGAVNTVRMLVFKKDGHEPEIGNAYLRIGSKKTGAVDNVGAGGMTAHIDLETGHFYDARVAVGNNIQECLVHPDTGTPIDGYLPNWDKIKKQVLDVTRSLGPIEWFGVDAAITNDGVKFPELNRFPDFPGVEPYSKATREYLLYRLKVKKHFYGFDVKPNNSLIHLPRRSDDIKK